MIDNKKGMLFLDDNCRLNIKDNLGNLSFLQLVPSLIFDLM